ncbi:MAG: UDP-N-acetylmuramoyl-L-alanyl-D-glutamate--2,6-diaminopimelate ligase [Myxococcales bacterium]|nr:UDP-N-acetylmuramoyl-L-alanyl-D-glutamate--2,6-diaminopimelate ligase [Myxococcales bacterium]
MTLGAIPGRHHAPRGATLEDLRLELAGATVWGPADTRVRDVRHDARDVTPGDLFVARQGLKVDGAKYIADAVARGAAAVAVTARPSAWPGVPCVIVPDAEAALAWMSSHVWAHPTWTLDVLGVTGTNGKTTTTWIVEEVLAALGDRAGLLGTVAQRFGPLSWPATHTTPEADDLARRFAAMLSAGATTAVMEVSSHALSKQRVGAVRFRAAGLTNVTADHLDFHGSLDHYIAAKRSLFDAHAPAVSVLNLDDAVGRSLARTVSGKLGFSVSGDPAAALRVIAGGAHARGITATVATPEGPVSLRSPLRGAHNLENLLCAMGLVSALGYPFARIAEALAGARGAPGRLELVGPSRGAARFDVLVDYAHTADALGQVLGTLKKHVEGRIVCVFGCGGDRDRSKRAPMGEAVGRLADVAILTTDNPRSEDPAAIAADAEAGLVTAGKRPAGGLFPEGGEYAVVLDRRAAIALAVELAQPGDVVLIAGKGHETYQEALGQRATFDDRVEARAALDARQTIRNE